MSMVANEEVMEFLRAVGNYPFFVIRFFIVVAVLILIIFFTFHLRNKAYVRMIEDMDSISGLINWEKFRKEAANKIKKNKDEKYAIVQFDIDKFKVVNDLYGINGGNNLLKTVGSEIDNLIEKEELATRFYADVFCMLITYNTDDEMTGFIQKVNENIKNSYPAVNLFLTFGIYKVSEEVSVELMVDRAAIARNSVKGNGVRYYAFFDNRMLEEVIHEKRIENTMQAALEAGEFEPFLQPQYSVKTERIVSAEALVRWNDPIRKIIPPSEYIEIFEKNNFIVKVDVYIWKQICKMINHWIEKGWKPYPVSLNVSPVHFRNRTIIKEITDVVKEYNTPLEYLELEITESVILDDMEYAISTIEELHKLGFRIAMDDFGSGYSSLNLLNKLSIDVLKIDKEFLNDASNSDKGKVVIRDIIAMAKDLDMQVVCEGVEKHEEVEFLQATDCDKIQGYYYAKPMSIIEFEKKYL